MNRLDLRSWLALVLLVAVGIVGTVGAILLAHPVVLPNPLDDASMVRLSLPEQKTSGAVARAPRTLYMYRSEVTVGQFKRFCKSTGYPYVWSEENEEWFADQEWPMTHVTFADASAYARWVKGRLPTADEWEDVARRYGGKYAWGDRLPPTSPVANLADEQLRAAYPHLIRRTVGFYDDGAPCLARVGRYAAAERGPVWDLGGNVREWCTEMQDGTGMVVKGPSWKTADELECRLTYRLRSQRDFEDETTGFRCVVDVE